MTLPRCHLCFWWLAYYRCGLSVACSASDALITWLGGLIRDACMVLRIFRCVNKKTASVSRVLKSGGEDGIWTHGTLLRLTSLAKKRFRPLSHFSIPIRRKKAGWARRSILIFREFEKLTDSLKILDIPQNFVRCSNVTCLLILEPLFFDVIYVEPSINDFVRRDELCDVPFEIHLQLDRHFTDPLEA